MSSSGSIVPELSLYAQLSKAHHEGANRSKVIRSELVFYCYV